MSPAPETEGRRSGISQVHLVLVLGRAAGVFVAFGALAFMGDALGFGSGGGGQCSGPVMSNLKWGTDTDRSMAERICCHNTRYAEPSGYFETKNFFTQVLATAHAEGRATTVFYDAQCGLPLFEAPIGRSFFAWEAESQAHGWPSFREAEIISENVIIHAGGEMASTCGTHLGHNLPDGDARYCIDLVCIAGRQDENATGVPGLGGASAWSWADTALVCFSIAMLFCALAAAVPRLYAMQREPRYSSKAGSASKRGGGSSALGEDLAAGGLEGGTL
jgi:peptide methionine sulfoxide reductase MsrB